MFCQKWCQIWLGPAMPGVLQGKVLGPKLLFFMYINVIRTDIESEISLFADDYVCCRQIETVEYRQNFNITLIGWAHGQIKGRISSNQ